MAEPILIRAATDGDVAGLAPILRAADAREIRLLTGQTAARALKDSLVLSDHALVAVLHGRPFAMAGVVPGLLGPARPWLVGGDALPEHATWFLRRCRPMLSAWRARHREMENWVHAENAAAIGWLRWLGFRIEAAAPRGVAGAPFRRFWMRG